MRAALAAYLIVLPLAADVPPWLVKTLRGHDSSVSSVAVDFGRNLAISGSFDKTLKVWDLDTHKCTKTLTGHNNSVNSVAVDFGRNLAISGSFDKTLKVWDLDTHKCTKTLTGHTDTVRSVAADFGRGIALSGSWDQTLKVWDLESQRCTKTLKGHTGYVWSVATDFGRDLAISSSFDKTLKVWNLSSGECLKTLAGHTGAVFSVAVDFERQIAISGSFDQTLKVWDLESGNCTRTLEGHTDFVRSVGADFGHGIVLSGSADHMLKVWNFRSGECLRTLRGHDSWVFSVAMNLGRNIALSGSDDHTIKVWNLAGWDSSSFCLWLQDADGDTCRSNHFVTSAELCSLACADGREAEVQNSRNEPLGCFIRNQRLFYNDGAQPEASQVDSKPQCFAMPWKPVCSCPTGEAALDCEFDGQFKCRLDAPTWQALALSIGVAAVIGTVLACPSLRCEICEEKYEVQHTEAWKDEVAKIFENKGTNPSDYIVLTLDGRGRKIGFLADRSRAELSDTLVNKDFPLVIVAKTSKFLKRVEVEEKQAARTLLSDPEQAECEQLPNHSGVDEVEPGALLAAADGHASGAKIPLAISAINARLVFPMLFAWLAIWILTLPIGVFQSETLPDKVHIKVFLILVFFSAPGLPKLAWDACGARLKDLSLLEFFFPPGTRLLQNSEWCCCAHAISALRTIAVFGAVSTMWDMSDFLPYPNHLFKVDVPESGLSQVQILFAAGLRDQSRCLLWMLFVSGGLAILDCALSLCMIICRVFGKYMEDDQEFKKIKEAAGELVKRSRKQSFDADDPNPEGTWGKNDAQLRRFWSSKLGVIALCLGTALALAVGILRLGAEVQAPGPEIRMKVREQSIGPPVELQAENTTLAEMDPLHFSGFDTGSVSLSLFFLAVVVLMSSLLVVLVCSFSTQVRTKWHSCLRSLPWGFIMMEKDVALLYSDMCLDVLTAWNYLQARQFWFAGISLSIWWYTTLKTFEDLWRLPKELDKSLQQGFYTRDFLRIQRQEINVEGVASLLLNCYGLPWAISSWSSFGVQIINISLSLYNVMKLVIQRERGIW